MPFFNFMSHRIYRATIIACMTLLLAGCPSLLSNEQIFDDASSPSYYYLDKAAQSSGSQQISYRILAARALLREGDITQADKIVNSLPQDLNDSQLKEGFLIAGEIQIAKRNPKSAKLALSKLIVEQLNKQQQSRYYQIQIQSANKKDVLIKLRGFAMLTQLIDGVKQQEAINNSWDLLSSLSTNTINGLAVSADETVVLGWLDLVRLYNANKDNISGLQSEIARWQSRYPQNPYSKSLPTRLSGILGFETINVSNVALLLPLEGQAQIFSNAIQSGFRSAMQESTASAVNLTVIDTSKKPIAEILQDIEKTALPTIVVGPLLKQDVNQTVNLKTNLMVLTLNKPDNGRNIPNMCYFALSPEDEAQEAATYMASNKHRQPLVIAPRSDLGQRMAKAFNSQWARQSNSGALVQYFDNANDLKESMNHRTGIKLTGSPISAEQGTADAKVDAVYIVGNQEELTLIKAMIDMEIGNRLSPSSIYASSRSHYSSSGPDFRLEMEGVRFSEIPLLSGANSRVYQKASKEFKGDYSQMRLYAFGMDAWKIIGALAEIQQLPNYKITGYTGTLSAGSSCVINRKLSWLEYRQGSIVAAH